MKIHCIIEVFQRELEIEAKCFNYYKVENDWLVVTPAGIFQVKRFV